MNEAERCVNSLVVSLPEDIRRLIMAGELAEADEAIRVRLADENLPSMLRDRLKCERERLRRLPTQYPWNREQALEKLRELIPGVTEEEFTGLERAGKVDSILLEGEKRYFVRFHKSLYKTHALAGHPGQEPQPHSEWLDPMIAALKEKGSLTCRWTIAASVYGPKETFVPGRYRCWLPVPAVTAQQSDVVIEDGVPDYVSPETAVGRTACWEQELTEWKPFSLRYSYTSRIRYADPLHAPAPEEPLYPAAPPVTEEDLSEQLPYIRFTPYLRALAAELAGDETDPVKKARRFYDFITTRVTYSYVRDYFQIDDLGEYCAVNLRGDCGLQALLFITLCRISGIPARWQSGMSVSEEYTGSHDWAQFWAGGWGWLFCDPSFGGGARRNGNEERREFYFGNIDPARMAANSAFMAPLEPAPASFRVDPYDNQSGEIEREGAELPFTGRDLDDTAELIRWEILD